MFNFLCVHKSFDIMFKIKGGETADYKLGNYQKINLNLNEFFPKRLNFLLTSTINNPLQVSCKQKSIFQV